MNISMNRTTYAFVGKDLAIKGNATTVTKVSDLTDGQVAVVDEYGTAIAGTTLTAGTKYKIVQRVGSELRTSPLFTSANVKKTNDTSFSNPLDTVRFIGYNGSTGSIDVNNSTNYNGTIKRDATELSDFGRENQVDFRYKSTASATQAAIAENVVGNLIETKKRRGMDVKAHMTSNGTVTAFTDTDVALVKVTKGSKTVEQIGVDMAAETANAATVAIGDYLSIPSDNGKSFTMLTTSFDIAEAGDIVTIYIGETPYTLTATAAMSDDEAGAALAVLINAGTQARATYVIGTDTLTITLLPNQQYTPPFAQIYDLGTTTYTVLACATVATGNSQPVKYKVTSTGDGASYFNLNHEYQGETGYIVVGTTVAVNAGVDTTPTAYGIKLTSEPIRFELGKYNYDVAQFDVYVNDAFGTDVVTETSMATKGNGAGQYISEVEYFTQAKQGDMFRFDKKPMNNYAPYALASANSIYDVYTINLEADTNVAKSPYTIFIAGLANGYGYSNDLVYAIAEIFA